LKTLAVHPIVTYQRRSGVLARIGSDAKVISVAVIENPAPGAFQSDSPDAIEPSWENVMRKQKSPIAIAGFVFPLPQEKGIRRTTDSDHHFSASPRVNLFAANAAISFGS
jgi:hypothetical protein